MSQDIAAVSREQREEQLEQRFQAIRRDEDTRPQRDATEQEIDQFSY